MGLRGCGVSPVRALEVFAAASKVEAAYRTSDGLQGTLVVCFQREADALAASGWHRTVGGVHLTDGVCFLPTRH